MKKISTNKAFQYRLLFVFIFIEALFLVCIGRSFELQILSGSFFRKMALRQHYGTIHLSPDRGTIFDRNGSRLAVSTTLLSLYAHPSRVKNKRQSAKIVAKILKSGRTSYRKILRKTFKRLKRSVSFVWIARQQNPRKVKKIMKRRLKGFGVISEPKRFYPCSSLAAHCIGFCDVDGKGLAGIEYRFDSYLRGKPVRMIVARDAKGASIVTRKQEAFAISETHSLFLTLDKTIQHIVEEELAKAVRRHRAKRGMAVVMNPSTGEILAMGNYPLFNPNIRPTSTIGNRRNRAVTDAFEPGSVMKIFLMATAIESGKYHGTEKINCENGHYLIGRHTIHDVHPHKTLSLDEVIKFSSNIGAAKIGSHLGGNTLYRGLKRFGFGRRTGIALPGESPGLMQPLKGLPPVALATISFGQGISVTALQLVTAVSAIANGGDLMQPFIIKKIVDNQGVPVRLHHPVKIRRVLSPRVANLITTFMKEVTTEGGTGTRAALKGFTVAGKTGTSQKPRLNGKGYDPTKFIGSFIGFVPAEDPKIAAIVVIDEPKGIPYGGVVAGPAFRNMAARILQYLNVFPKKPELPEIALSPHSHPGSGGAADAVRVSKNQSISGKPSENTQSAAVNLPDFSGMSLRGVIRWGETHGINLTLNGNGQAIRQFPKPGTPVSPGGRCSVWFTFPS